MLSTRKEHTINDTRYNFNHKSDYPDCATTGVHQHNYVRYHVYPQAKHLSRPVVPVQPKPDCSGSDDECDHLEGEPHRFWCIKHGFHRHVESGPAADAGDNDAKRS